MAKTLIRLTQPRQHSTPCLSVVSGWVVANLNCSVYIDSWNTTHQSNRWKTSAALPPTTTRSLPTIRGSSRVNDTRSGYRGSELDRCGWITHPANAVIQIGPPSSVPRFCFATSPIRHGNLFIADARLRWCASSAGTHRFSSPAIVQLPST